MQRMGIRLFIKSVSSMNKISARNQKPVPMIPAVCTPAAVSRRYMPLLQSVETSAARNVRIGLVCPSC